MVAVIYQKAPYAIFSLRSGANVTKPEQLENLEIASGAGSFTQKVIEAFMKSKGLKADTVKYTNIDPAARVGMLAAKKIPAIETFAMSMPGVVKAVGAAGGADFPARQRRARALLQRHPGARGLSEGRARQGEGASSKPRSQGWKDTIANPKEAADIVGKHIKGLDAEVVFQEIAIVNALVATPDTRAKGLGTIDAKADGRRASI